MVLAVMGDLFIDDMEWYGGSIFFFLKKYRTDRIPKRRWSGIGVAVIEWYVVYVKLCRVSSRKAKQSTRQH